MLKTQLIIGAADPAAQKELMGTEHDPPLTFAATERFFIAREAAQNEARAMGNKRGQAPGMVGILRKGRSFHQGPARRCRGRRNRDLQELRISPPWPARVLPSSSSQVHSLRQRRPLHADVQILGHDEGSRKRSAEGEGQGQGARPSRSSGGSRTGDQSSGTDGTSHRRHLQAAQDPLSLHHFRDGPQLLPTPDAPLRARHGGRSNNSLALHPLHSFRGRATEPGGAWPQVPQWIPLWRMERDLQNQAGPRGEACFGKDPRGQRGDHRRGWTGLPLPPGRLHSVPGRQHRHRGDSETGPGTGVQTAPSTESEGDRDLQGRTTPHSKWTRGQCHLHADYD